MSESSVLRILKWSLPPFQSAIWRYELSEWGGVPPVLIFDSPASRPNKLIAALNESESYYKIHAVSSKACASSIQQALVSQTALALRQGMFAINDIVLWAKIGQFPTAATVAMTFANETDAFPADLWPNILVYPEIYASGNEHAEIVRTDSKLSFTLTSSATVGLAVFGVVSGTDQASLVLGAHTLTLGSLSNTDAQSSPKIDISMTDWPACMNPAVFLSSVFNSSAQTKSRALLDSAVIDSDNQITYAVGFYKDPKTCVKGTMGMTPTDVVHGMGILTATSCLSVDQSWYQPDGSAAELPEQGRGGTVLFAFCLIAFFSALGCAAFYFWKRFNRLAISRADQGDGDYDQGGDNSGGRGSSAVRLNASGSGGSVVGPRAGPTQAIRLQPTGALRPPKFLTAG